MRAKKLRTKVVGLVAAVMVVGAPLTAWAIDVAGGDLYYNGGQTDTIVYSEIGRKAGISRNYMVKATVKVGGDTYTSGFKSNYAYKDAKRVWWANETSYYDLYKLDIENPIIRINTAFKGCSSLEKISVLPRIYHN